MTDTTILFKGNNWADILCYSATQTNSWTYEGFLIVIFIIIIGYGYKKQVESSITFLSASTIVLVLASIFIMVTSDINCILITEQAFIISVILFIGSVINYMYNKEVNA